MDTNMVQISGAATSYQAPTVPAVKVPSANETFTPQNVKQQEQKYDPKQSEQTRFDNMMAASQTMMSDIFVVSDTKFTIFKDSSGQLVTRFTSLRDGKISYYPEPEMLAYWESKGASQKALVKMDV